MIKFEKCTQYIKRVVDRPHPWPVSEGNVHSFNSTSLWKKGVSVCRPFTSSVGYSGPSNRTNYDGVSRNEFFDCVKNRYSYLYNVGPLLIILRVSCRDTYKMFKIWQYRFITPWDCLVSRLSFPSSPTTVDFPTGPLYFYSSNLISCILLCRQKFINGRSSILT